MIMVRRIVIRAEDGAETLAGATMDDTQEFAFFRTGIPAVLHADTPAISEQESADVDGFCPGMGREPPGPGNIAAGVAAHRFDPDEGAAEYLPGCAIDTVARPSREVVRERAGKRPEIGHSERAEISADPVELDAVERRTTGTIHPVGKGGELRA